MLLVSKSMSDVAPRLLDLFCGAGGAAMGYSRAGFEVVGVDIRPQKNYPFEFHQADAMTFPLQGFDAIHASPPCQGYSITNASSGRDYPMLIPEVRARISSRTYVIENVIGAPLNSPLLLCGTMFGLGTEDHDGTPLFLRRHRLFESNVFLTAPTFCTCPDRKKRGETVGGVYGGGSHDRARAKYVRRGGYTPNAEKRRELLDVPWMKTGETEQAIPPAYTEWIGRQLLEHLKPRSLAARTDRKVT